MINVRCYTCGSYIGNCYGAYLGQVQSGVSARTALDALNVTRMCCRTNMLTHIDISKDLIKYPAENTVLDNIGSTLSRQVQGSRSVSCLSGEQLESEERNADETPSA